MQAKLRFHSQRGVSLIEALIALVIMAVGILSIAKLNTFLIDVGGQAKARAQAVQLAEAKVEEWRSVIVNGSLAAIPASAAKGSQPALYGYSSATVQATAFTRWWDVTKTTDATGDVTGARVQVYVAWTGRDNVEQQVSVSSLIAWDDPGMAAGLWDVTGGAAGGYAVVPTGRATLGAGNISGVTGGVTDIQGDQGDGLKIVKGTTDNVYRLVKISTGEILLTASKLNEALSQVSGRVYISQADLNSLTKDNVYIVISDASFCSMVPANALTNLDSGSIFKYFDYRCYLGANWYGNVGVVRIDNANTNDRVCVGDPTVGSVAASVKSDNRHPALSTSRMYRGYKETATGSGVWNATGIGIDQSTGAYTAATYNGHDFVLARITGNPADSDCTAKLNLYSAGQNPFTSGGDATAHTPLTETAYLNGGTYQLGNPGQFFCLTTNCPDPLPGGQSSGGTNVSITIRGKNSATGQNKGNITGAVLTSGTQSGTCSVPPSPNPGNYDYQCVLNLPGFTSQYWGATLTLETSGYLCSNGANGPGVVSAGANGVVSFTNQPLNVSPVTQNVQVRTALSNCQ